MKRQNLKSNFILQALYQVIILVLPLITAPYLTRTLKDVQLGRYTFTYTIAYYFVLLGMLGINKYGQRVIANNSYDDKKLRKTFWSLYLSHLLVSIASLCIYELLIFFIGRDNYKLYFIQSLFVFSAVFDITWLFYGLENFKGVVIRNAILKIIECICIFLFVKETSDIYIYTLIMALSSFIGQIMMIPFALKYIKPIKISKKECVVHIKPLFKFSIMVLASLFYTMLDKTLLGIFSSNESVAYYEYSNKIINIPKTIAVVIGTVIFPRACLKVKENKREELNKYFVISIVFTYFISFVSIFGFFGLADDFSILYFGDDFAACGKIIKFLSPVILIITLGNVLQNIYLLPQGRENKLMLCIILGAFINTILSSILIYFIGVEGAIIGTIFSELCNLILQIYFCRKDIHVIKIILNIIPYCVAGSIMMLLLFYLKKVFEMTILNFIIMTLIGLLSYSTIIGVYLFFISSDRYIMRKILKEIFRK